ncbi:RNA-directed DNA polymerase (reverse transcriptase)-related family protein [Rhynchospora pubera]|uniref:RNA-directed DNA polymerase (Reverse transcriptase)-related family protein n=1 Tax=Rhynchospora pubera TaxID=906938 RepID=A0AAV8GG51_9POAL|nr:RNA-directed DNA polymerase (reverse transcriptase)-related family protein [Rhynchospora pubera]
MLADKNTAFFHATVASKRRRNAINSILGAGGAVITDQSLIRQAFVNYYKLIFSTNSSANTPGPTLHPELLAALPEVPPVEREMLAAQPTDDEITKVVFSIHPDRACGPDGLNGRFVQHYWALFKPYLLHTVHAFFQTGKLEPILARSNVVLIPKKEDPKEVTDYRPISVCNLVYKVISKLLSARMRCLMSRLVGCNQCAFVPGRVISDNILLLREIMHSFAKSTFREQAFCFKCDLSKAFDRMEWHFVVRVLQLYGFPPIFVSWIMSCVTSASFALVINGAADGFITPARGLRQGCALSPYLFILCMDILNRMFEFKIRRGLIKGVTVARGAPAISSILYADDLLICGIADLREVQEIKSTLDEFCTMSGQCIGADKSRIWFSKHTSNDIHAYCMDHFQAGQGERNHNYLGVPILATRMQDFDYLIDKVAAKLNPWKARLLSPAAKTVLIKSIIEPLVMYSMGAGSIPDSVLQKINAKLRAFFWNSGDSHKMRMVAWEKITSSKQCGGLGLRDVRILNQATNMKVLWKLASREYEGTLWVQILKAKYLTRSPLWLAVKPSSCSKLWTAVLQARDTMKPHIKWILGNGNKCPLVGEPWHEFWLQFQQQGRGELAASISDFVHQQTVQWNIDKLVQTLGFHAALYIACVHRQPPLKPNSQDRLIFKPTTDGNFSFKGACKLLQASVAQATVTAGTWEKVWQCNGTLPRTQMFIWKLLHDAIPVKASIAKRMRAQPPPCEVCGLEVDDAMHALFLCAKPRQCWLISSLGLRVDALPQGIVQALVLIFEQLNREQLVTFANIMWSIWKARCKEVYEGRKMVVCQILRDAESLNILTRNACGLRALPRGSLPAVFTFHSEMVPDNGNIFMMDGSFKEGGNAGWAYTLYINNVLMQYEVGIGDATSPLHAELLAFKSAVQATLSLGWCETTFLTDCEIVAKVLNGVLSPESVDWRVYTLLLDILDVMRQYSGYSCCHIARELLVQEHELANLARIRDLNVRGYTFPLFRFL